MIHNELIQEHGGFSIAALAAENQARFSLLVGEFKCPFWTSTQTAHSAKNHRRIRVSDVPFRPLDILARGSFLEGIARIDPTVLRFSALRTPPAMWDAVFDGPIQRRSVCAGLAARDDFEVVFTSLH